MGERPILNKNLDSKTFRSYYFLKEEMVDFCKKYGLPTSGGKQEITDRIAYFLDSGKVLNPNRTKRHTTSIVNITEDTNAISPNQKNKNNNTVTIIGNRQPFLNSLFFLPDDVSSTFVYVCCPCRWLNT